ncbi:MAG TPA: MBL fold metallo-hydrolase, partial [Chlorobiota bacterium]|nr:MBL fold metallo-hydrolase [Chlorobiota bacterium]
VPGTFRSPAPFDTGDILRENSPGEYGASIVWIGHSTVLMRLGSSWILTDPVMFDRYGINVLGFTLGPHRYSRPALRVDDLPKPDLVLLSHAHLDHTDLPTLEALTNRFPNELTVVCASNTQDVVEELPWKSVGELDWDDRASINGVDVRALQVKHNGRRFPGEPCRADGHRRGRSYNGYEIVAGGVKVVFAGDTAFTTSFRDVGSNIDVALMPIGAYRHCSEDHCTPEEGLAMTNMMKARYVVPIHYGTFKQSQEPVFEPLQRLRRAMAAEPGRLAIDGIGGCLRLA